MAAAGVSLDFNFKAFNANATNCQSLILDISPSFLSPDSAGGGSDGFLLIRYHKYLAVEVAASYPAHTHSRADDGTVFCLASVHSQARSLLFLFVVVFLSFCLYVTLF